MNSELLSFLQSLMLVASNGLLPVVTPQHVIMKSQRGSLPRTDVSRLKPSNEEGGKSRRLVELELEKAALMAHIRLLQDQQKILQDTCNHYASQYEQSPIGYVTVDETTNILDLNSAAANLVGRNRELLLDTPFGLLVADKDGEVFINHLMRCKIAINEQVISEVRLQSRGGETVPVQLVSTVCSNQSQRWYQTALIDLTEQKRNQRALAEAKEFAESVVDTVREPLIVLDAALKVVSVNRAFTQTFDKSARLARGRQFDLLLNLWWSGNKVRNELENVLLKNTTLENFELEVEPKDLGRRILLLNARRLYRKSTLPPQILVAVHDITEEKQAEEKLRKSEAMLAEAQRLAHIGSWEWHIAAGKVAWSDELYRILETNPDCFDGTYQAFIDCVHPDDKAVFHATIQEVSRSGGTFDFFHHTCQGDRVRILHCSGYAVADEKGNPVKVVGTTQDVTQLKEAEERLHQLNIELEKRVEVRTKALQQSNQQMEAFCYSIAHDLRAPLRAIKGFGNALFEDCRSAVGDEGKEYLDRIVAATDRMDELIHDLLEYGRLNTIELPIGDVDVEEIVTGVLTYIPSNATVIRREPLPMVLGHKVVLELALRNIIENGIKFIAPGVKPRIEIWPERCGKNTVRICVQDNGIGIAPEYKQRIFEVFQRLHSNAEYPGTGIGLAIVAKGIERIGGRVDLESKLGKGSVFYIELPMRSNPMETQHQ